MNDCAYSSTVREYDINVRERIAELERGISILDRVHEINKDSVKKGSGDNKIDVNFKSCIAQNCSLLHEIVSDYDMIAVSYLPYGIDCDGSRFKVMLYCANIDARFSVICGNLHDCINQIQVTYGLCNDQNAINQSSSSTRCSRKKTRGRICAINANDDNNSAQLRAILRAALSHISRAESCVVYGCGRGHVVNGSNCTDCGAKMRIMPEASEAVCDNCGRVITIDNVSSNAYSYSSGSQYITNNCAIRGRRSGYNFVRHLKIWLDRLQAIESDEFNAHDIDAIRASIISEHVSAQNVHWHEITCDDITRHLSLCSLSYLGEHIPKLVKLFGGKAPPILDYDSEQIIFRDFSHIMEVYATLFQGPGNKPYYPFFIGKIIRRRFARDSDTWRILKYITRQGRDTVNRHDKIYERICASAPTEYDLIYEPDVF
jgi:predicted RNA-binding Zn-ribbon protein involved in translation (DUF1610 family)